MFLLFSAVFVLSERISYKIKLYLARLMSRNVIG